jgi:hypothetical protein
MTGTSTESRIGAPMPDGTIYAGHSPETGKRMYTTPHNAKLTGTFEQARKYAAKLAAHGHKDWRVPAKDELNVLFNNRAAISGFDVTGSYPAGWYWSSSENGHGSAWGQRFSDGDQGIYYGNDDSSLRCVRCPPSPPGQARGHNHHLQLRCVPRAPATPLLEVGGRRRLRPPQFSQADPCFADYRSEAPRQHQLARSGLPWAYGLWENAADHPWPKARYNSGGAWISGL